jgi:ABC-type multidrug transport system ATPase subunit
LYGVPEAGAQINAVLSWVGLTAQKRDLVRSFSQEMKRRLTIVRALLHDPPLLLLDEPYAGLDDEAVVVLHKILAVLRHRKGTVVMTIQDLDGGAMLADRTASINAGRVLDEVSVSDAVGAASPTRSGKAMRRQPAGDML